MITVLTVSTLLAALKANQRKQEVLITQTKSRNLLVFDSELVKYFEKNFDFFGFR